MKLLLDQNLSRRLVDSLIPIWPDISHVSLHGLEHATDKELWHFAAAQDYSIVSKDTDFLHLALLHGAPPKVIIIRMGNAPTIEIRHCIISNQAAIETFYENKKESVLVIS